MFSNVGLVIHALKYPHASLSPTVTHTHVDVHA